MIETNLLKNNIHYKHSCSTYLIHCPKRVFTTSEFSGTLSSCPPFLMTLINPFFKSMSFKSRFWSSDKRIPVPSKSVIRARSPERTDLPLENSFTVATSFLYFYSKNSSLVLRILWESNTFITIKISTLPLLFFYLPHKPWYIFLWYLGLCSRQ